MVLSHNWIAHELGHLEAWFDRHDFSVTRIYREDQPSVPSADLLVVLGSPNSVAGATCPPATLAEVDAVKDWLDQGRPYLGICFGSQVLATATGGTVTPLSSTFADYAPIDLGDEAPASLGGRWLTWHNDGIKAPAEASLLGSLDHADLAFRIGRAWGLQPHVEATPDVLERMLVSIGTSESEYAPVVAALRNDDTNATRAAELLDTFLTDVS